MAAADGGHLGAAYFHATNRGKRSIELDFESDEGRRIVRKLAARSDVLIENFKVGGLAKFGLDYQSLAAESPRLIYCSVTGFGQDGPYAARAGYDLMAQGMGGFMDITGMPDGEPIARRRAGLRHHDRRLLGGRHPGGAGAARTHRPRRATSTPRWSTLPSACSPTRRSTYLVSGKVPQRIGNAHPNIVPYQVFPGGGRPHHHRHRQRQPVRPAVRGAGRAHARRAARLSLKNSDRLANRGELIARLSGLTKVFTATDLLAKLEAVGVPAGPINNLEQVFADPQVVHRGMRIDAAERLPRRTAASRACARRS